MGCCVPKLGKAFQIRVGNVDSAEYAGFLIRDPGGIKETGVTRWEEVPSLPENRKKIKNVFSACQLQQRTKGSSKVFNKA